MLKVTKVPG